MRTKKKRSLKSTLLFCWIYAVLLPMLTIECFTLVQMYRLNYEKIDAAVVEELLDTQKNINQIISNMAAMSQQLVLDGNIGKNLYYYFTETDIQKKMNLLIYLKEQIGTYEAANPTLANITYFIREDAGAGETDEPRLDKINQSSLARERLPEENKLLMEEGNVKYYGPHQTASEVADYPVISLVRHYKLTHNEGEILIYIESGYRTLEKLLPVMNVLDKTSMYGMDAIFTILSNDGDVLYSSKEDKISLDTKITEEEQKIGDISYRSYYVGEPDQWQLCALVPTRSYYGVLYRTMLSFIVILAATIFLTVFISVRLWKGISLSLRHFEQNIKMLGMEQTEISQMKHMDIMEFDESMAVFERLRKRIEELLQRVQRQEAEKYSLEVKSLLGKINPHFLNNTLDTLKWYAQEREEEGIVRFITDLNKLLIYNMNKSRNTTLESELEAVKSYIALQKWKYEITFFMELETHPQLLKADMPRFLLQPLVENAILHGEIPGEVRIKVFLQGDGRIAVHIFNKGKRIEQGFLERVLQAKEDLSANGIGLQYVIRSLENRFGTRYSFEIGSMDETQVNYVKIVIPFEIQKQEETVWKK